MTIDTTLNLGNIITAIIAIVAFAVAFTKLGGRIDLLTQRVKAVADALNSHGDIHTRVAVLESQHATQGTLVANLQTEVADLRRGRGFVQHRSSSGIDGEYP